MTKACCTGCGAKTLQAHVKKIQKGMYNHVYKVPAQHKFSGKLDGKHELRKGK